jgi:flagella basal body P-ring formation protein FlgA
MTVAPVARSGVRRVLTALLTQGAVVASVAAQLPNAAPMASVAARRLERGTVLRESDIKHVPATGPAQRAALAAPGWVTRRVIQAGELLRAPAVAPAPDVRAASTVAVVTAGTTVQIRVSGIAMTSGVVGDTILVSLGTGSRIRARIDEPGRVVALASGRLAQ